MKSLARWSIARSSIVISLGGLFLGACKSTDAPPTADSGPAAASTRATVRVGMPFDEARALLGGAGAIDVTTSVGIRAPDPGRFVWYVLQDNTCLNLYVADVPPMKGGAATVMSIEVGERGKGYGDKVKWMAQRTRSVKALDVANGR